MGKENEIMGDEMDLASVESSANDHSANLLQYDLTNYQLHSNPNFVKTTVCDRYHHQGIAGQTYESYAYSDGSGNVLMTKMQAEPGKAKEVTINTNNTVTINVIDTSSFNPKRLRWIGNGRTILNNKGKPVKQYEPYFSDTSQYEAEDCVRQVGVTPILYYDAVGRNIKTALPDGTFTKVESMGSDSIDFPKISC